jgi:hypothetical protein
MAVGSSVRAYSGWSAFVVMIAVALIALNANSADPNPKGTRR